MSITACLDKVQDYRNKRGQRYSISSIIKLIVAGLLYNKNNLKAISRFGKSLNKKERELLGFNRGSVLCYSNLTIIIRKITLESLHDAISSLITYIAKAHQGIYRVLHVDGKTLKSSNSYGSNSQTQILSAFSSQINSMVCFEKIDNKNEYQAMLQLLSEHDIEDKILTADAAFCHESVCQKTIDEGGDFAFSLKANEGKLYYYSSKEFNKPEKSKEIRRFTEDIDLQHGRVEKRSIEVMDMPFSYLNGFRHIKQICKITREREQKCHKDSSNREIAFMITSLSKEDFTPESLLKLNRSHWCCENNLNWIKDEVFGEDKSTISTGNAPLVMSVLRSIAISFISTISNKITETREMFSNYRGKLFKLFTVKENDF